MSEASQLLEFFTTAKDGEMVMDGAGKHLAPFGRVLVHGAAPETAASVVTGSRAGIVPGPGRRDDRTSDRVTGLLDLLETP